MPEQALKGLPRSPDEIIVGSLRARDIEGRSTSTFVDYPFDRLAETGSQGENGEIEPESAHAQPALHTTFGGRGDACDDAVALCDHNAARLWDLGYLDDARTLLAECRKTHYTCVNNEREVQAFRGVKILLTQFPPEKGANGGGWVIHETGARAQFVPPYFDPLAGIPPAPRR